MMFMIECIIWIQGNKSTSLYIA